jgi:hypothetical protein
MREYNYPFAELIGLLTVNQIKEIKKPSRNLKEDIQKISHDIDSVITERDLKLSSDFIRLLIYLSQMDVYIWHAQEMMDSNPENYLEILKLKHQMNGFRNQLKAKISEYVGEANTHTNLSTDGLNWEISL